VTAFRALACAELLARDNPDALVLAVLCSFGDRDPQAVIKHILSRLKQITGEDTKAFREYLDMLKILSDNRDLKPYIKEAEAMLTHVEVERLPSSELGMEKGEREGKRGGTGKGRLSGTLPNRPQSVRDTARHGDRGEDRSHPGAVGAIEASGLSAFRFQ
jgi:hypothetical protein